MSKAKEMAREIREKLDTLGPTTLKFLSCKLIEAVLSEQELKGFIEVTYEEDIDIALIPIHSYYVFRLRKRCAVIPIALARSKILVSDYIVKDSYEEIVQKIKEAS